MEINGFGMVYRRPANDQHEFVYSIPTDPDKVFVIVISYKVKNNNKIKNLDFRFSSTQSKNKWIANDGTYKLNWNGLPVA